MTLILSVITQKYVFQACDRRLVFTQPKVRVHDDSALKAVLLGFHSAFSYTGLANLPRSKAVASVRGSGPQKLSTNVWLAEVLSLGNTLQECLTYVVDEASESMNRQFALPPALRRHAFIGVGWKQDANGRLEPAIYEINNFTNTARFALTLITLGDQQYGSYSSHPLPTKVVKNYDRLLAEAMKRDVGPDAIGRIMVETIRDVARSVETVGRGVLQLCIPRVQVERVLTGGDWSMNTGHAPDHMTFKHYAANSDDGSQYGPTVVLGDKTIIGQMVFGPNVKTVNVIQQTLAADTTSSDSPS